MDVGVRMLVSGTQGGHEWMDAGVRMLDGGTQGREGMDGCWSEDPRWWYPGCV